MAVPVRTEPAFEAESPEEIFAGIYAVSKGRMYDVQPDGERFLMIKDAVVGDPSQVVLVQNWFEELERLVPTE